MCVYALTRQIVEAAAVQGSRCRSGRDGYLRYVLAKEEE